MLGRREPECAKNILLRVKEHPKSLLSRNPDSVNTRKRLRRKTSEEEANADAAPPSKKVLPIQSPAKTHPLYAKEEPMQTPDKLHAKKAEADVQEQISSLTPVQSPSKLNVTEDLIHHPPSATHILCRDLFF